MDSFIKIMGSVATQLMTDDKVLVEGASIPVRRVERGMFRVVQYQCGGRAFEAIEQNPDKPSQWGKLA